MNGIWGSRARRSSSGSAGPTLTVLTNIPTPYRAAFFAELDHLLRECGGRLRVLYCAETERGRKWVFDDSTRHGTVMPGFSHYVRGVAFHVNPSAIRWIRAQRPDWLLVAGSWNTPTMLMVSAAERGRTPRIFWSEGHAEAVLHPGGWIARLRRLVLGSFDGFAVPNERSEDFVRTQIKGDVPVIRLPNSVDESFFDRRLVDVGAVRARLGFDDSVRLVAIVASLEPRKRVVESVRAFGRLDPNVRMNVRLVVVGTGSLLPEVELAAASIEGVSLLGHLEAEGVRDVLAAADGFLLASSYDPNPLSVLEAALCGCFVMVADSVGNSEELARESGIVFSGQDAGGIVDAIQVALDKFCRLSREEIRSAADRGRHHALANCSRRSVARGLLDGLSLNWPLVRTDPSPVGSGASRSAGEPGKL